MKLKLSLRYHHNPNSIGEYFPYKESKILLFEAIYIWIVYDDKWHRFIVRITRSHYILAPALHRSSCCSFKMPV